MGQKPIAKCPYITHKWGSTYSPWVPEALFWCVFIQKYFVIKGS